jgi:F420-non-reducing hydrogenase small subunit
MAKKRIATVWLQGCSGCHISLLDAGDAIAEVANAANVVYTPISDERKVPKADIVLVEGAVANEENEELLTLVRKNADTVVALGTCACHGGIGGLRNLHRLDQVMTRAFVETPSTAEGVVPDEGVPQLNDSVRSVQEVIDVDFALPGCPPPSDSIARLLAGALEGSLPELPTHNLCEECSRLRQDMLLPQRGFICDEVRAVFELDEVDPELCFLEQGVLCMGPTTQEGCGAKCPTGNMPCRGCMGPTPKAREQGCKLIDSIASILPAGAIMYLEDVVGTGYRFSLPVSICPKPTEKKEGKR